MKILFVTRENQSDKRYGLGKSLAPICATFAAQGVEVRYLSQADAGERGKHWVARVQRGVVWWFGRWFPQTQFAFLVGGIFERLNMGRLAAKVMVAEQFTHVHCHDPIIAAGYRWFARVRWFATLRRGHIARWGVTEHGFGCYAQAFQDEGIFLSARVMGWMRAWEARVLRKAHWVTTPTMSGMRQLVRDLGLHPVPAHFQVVPHPLPVLPVYGYAAAREELGWQVGICYILAVGRYVKLKQFQEIIRVCARLSRQDWVLVLLGEGDQGELVAVAAELGVVDKVCFAVTDEVGLFYAAADIYVSYSTTEAFGLANLEALSLGLPSVCSAVGGVPEVVGSGAWLVAGTESQGLWQALEVLTQSEAARLVWRQRAREWVRGWFSAAAVVERWREVYAGNFSLSCLEKPQFSPVSALEQWREIVAGWRACPLPRRLDLAGFSRVLVVAPHPDDEVLGCGGTVALLRQLGCAVRVVVVTDGRLGDPHGYVGGDIVAARQAETRAALALLGVTDVVFLGAPDGAFVPAGEIVEVFTQLVAEYGADGWFVPSPLDYHRDHLGVSLMVWDVWQRLAKGSRLFLYEVWSPVVATHVVDIQSVFALKLTAVDCYVSQLRYGPYWQVCEGMGRYRGLYVGGGAAEAFMSVTRDEAAGILDKLMGLRGYFEGMTGRE